MKRKLVFFKLLCIIASFIVRSVSAKTVTSTDIPLDVPSGFSATDISAVGNGLYCVSGSVYDDAGPSKSALVLLVDDRRHRLVWQTRIPYTRDYVGNTATTCKSDGSAYYVITQDRTNTSEALNQTRVIIHKISASGKLLLRQPVRAGFDEWSFLLDVKPNAISVAGGTSETLDRGGKFGIFIAQFDWDLVQGKTIKLDSGAFWSGSNAKLDDQHLLVSGQFLPNTDTSFGHEAFATSKIDLATRKYTWSNYSSPTDTRQASAIFAMDGTTYTTALTATNLAISVVDRMGKTVINFSVKKPLCSINALTVNGHALKVIGSSCERQSSSVIATIDLLGKTDVITRQLDDDVSSPQFDGSFWIGIVAARGGGKVFRRMDQ